MKVSAAGLAFFSIALAIFSAAPVFASGNLTVTNGSLSSFSSSGDIWNTGVNVILNISLNATVGEINNITSILLNITGTANVSNITSVLMYNDTNSNAIIDPEETLLGSNTSLNLSQNFTVVPFTVNFTMNHTRRNILVAFNISRSAFRLNTTGAVIASNASIATSNPESLDNVTISTGSINSTVKQILDMHANVTITPRIVDTNVSQQMLVLTVTPTGTEKINRTKVIIPTGYALLDVTDVNIGGAKNRSFDGSPGGGADSSGVGIHLGATEFNVTTVAGGTSSTIRINFTVDTNLSVQNSAAFAIKIFSNISFINPEVENEETNVTTAQIIQILSVGGNKTAALTNGTDFWEFTFTINFTTNLTAGFIQIKMSNWTSSQGTINLTNQTPPHTNNTQFFANLRMSNETMNAGRSQNVTDNYNITRGILFNTTSDVLSPVTNRVKQFVLRMSIPSGIAASTGWWTVYSILFRSNPT